MGSQNEHIIIDGNSTDQTLDIIKSYERDKENVKLIQLPPNGVYNALNYGIDVASKEWTLFLHSDDALAADLSNVQEILSSISTPVACFSIQISSEIGLRKYKTNSFNNEWLPPPHTGMIFKTRFLKQFKFDEKYKISADYKQILKIRKSDKNAFTELNTELVVMNAGGLSTNPRNLFRSMTEDYLIIKELDIRFALLKAVAKKLIKIKQYRFK